eukprot:8307724-Pyramimonas_sp.AAC.1
MPHGPEAPALVERRSPSGAAFCAPHLAEKDIERISAEAWSSILGSKTQGPRATELRAQGYGIIGPTLVDPGLFIFRSIARWPECDEAPYAPAPRAFWIDGPTVRMPEPECHPFPLRREGPDAKAPRPPVPLMPKYPSNTWPHGRVAPKPPRPWGPEVLGPSDHQAWAPVGRQNVRRPRGPDTRAQMPHCPEAPAL